MLSARTLQTKMQTMDENKSTVFDVVVRMLTAFASVERNVMFVAWSSQFVADAKFSIGADLMREIAKVDGHAIVTQDMVGHSLIFDGYAKDRLATICADGSVMAGGSKVNEWLDKDRDLPPPKDIPHKRARHFVSQAKKAAARRPTALVFFRGQEELGDVSKFVVESFRSMALTMSCLAVIISISDSGAVVVHLAGKIAPAV